MFCGFGSWPVHWSPSVESSAALRKQAIALMFIRRRPNGRGVARSHSSVSQPRKPRSRNNLAEFSANVPGFGEAMAWP